MLMRTFLGKISPSALLVVFVGISITHGGEDLIPPTRTLEGRVALEGRLTVVSEPPELDVFLDGLEIGQTPVWLKEVKPGFHRLRVQDSETEVFVEPNRTVTLSFFKGSFIDVPVKEPLRQEKKPLMAGEPTSRREGEARGDAPTPFDWFLIFGGGD